MAALENPKLAFNDIKKGFALEQALQLFSVDREDAYLGSIHQLGVAKFQFIGDDE